MLTRIILPVASNDDAGAVLKLFDRLQFFASYMGVHVYLLLPHKLLVIFLPFLTYPSGGHIQLAVSASLIVTLLGLSLFKISKSVEMGEQARDQSYYLKEQYEEVISPSGNMNKWISTTAFPQYLHGLLNCTVKLMNWTLSLKLKVWHNISAWT